MERRRSSHGLTRSRNQTPLASGAHGLASLASRAAVRVDRLPWSLFAVLVRLRRRKRFDGEVILAYNVAVRGCSVRLEFFRGDADRGFVFGGWLSTSQFIALILGPAAVALRFVRRQSAPGGPSTSSRKRPVRSLRVVRAPMPSVTSGNGRPSSRSTRPDTAVTPGGAISGASVSHGEGSRPLRQPSFAFDVAGAHASESGTSDIAGRDRVVARSKPARPVRHRRSRLLRR